MFSLESSSRYMCLLEIIESDFENTSIQLKHNMQNNSNLQVILKFDIKNMRKVKALKTYLQRGNVGA